MSEPSITLRFGTQDQPYWLLCDKVLVVPGDMPQILFPLSSDMKGFMLFKKQRILFLENSVQYQNKPLCVLAAWNF